MGITRHCTGQVLQPARGQCGRAVDRSTLHACMQSDRGGRPVQQQWPMAMVIGWPKTTQGGIAFPNTCILHTHRGFLVKSMRRPHSEMDITQIKCRHEDLTQAFSKRSVPNRRNTPERVLARPPTVLIFQPNLRHQATANKWRPAPGGETEHFLQVGYTPYMQVW